MYIYMYFVLDDQLQVYDRVQVSGARWKRYQLIILNSSFHQLMFNVM